VSVLWIALAIVALQRCAALLCSHRNARRLLARGGIETAALQFPLIALLQLAWLAAMPLVIPAAAVPNWWLLGCAALAEAFHTWAMLSLGPYWSTRVIVVPGAPLVRRGPYRFVRHPNYAAVAAEILLLPCAFRAYALAGGFTAAYLALIAWRIRDENRLLASSA
jgi:methyltransferase